ncbi:hypothetical protein OQI_20470 [Streptomyces pharetrae CZA14]|uniref:Uncharacterized protein n=1 Tax=Streptomyces pharetrae CZA14 TaxID=1144883 RepID=A0ABX3YFK4_9ACTN|nr:hypothetical protein OQI_20470 [Streptomyces pharetrae CZA14]
MTPHQVFAVAALGGLAALVGLVLAAASAIGLYRITTRLIDLHEAHRERRAHEQQQRADLAACQAIHALPTTDHPKEDQR